MNDYRIKMCDGKFFNKSNLGKYYIQIKKNKIWKNYKEAKYWDDWKSTKFYNKEEKALNKISDMIKQEIEDDRKRQNARGYVYEITADKIAKALLKN